MPNGLFSWLNTFYIMSPNSNSSPSRCRCETLVSFVLLSLLVFGSQRALAAPPPAGVAPVVVPAGGFSIEGELFAKILKQAGRGRDGTSQGNYLFSPDGTLLAFAQVRIVRGRLAVQRWQERRAGRHEDEPADGQEDGGGAVQLLAFRHDTDATGGMLNGLWGGAV